MEKRNFSSFMKVNLTFSNKIRILSKYEKKLNKVQYYELIDSFPYSFIFHFLGWKNFQLSFLRRQRQVLSSFPVTTADQRSRSLVSFFSTPYSYRTVDTPCAHLDCVAISLFSTLLIVKHVKNMLNNVNARMK